MIGFPTSSFLAVAEEAGHAVHTASGFESFFKLLTLYLASGVEAAAGLVIGLAAIQATVHALALFFKRTDDQGETKEQVRLRLGRWLALALEFELAADILRTAVAPTWNEIGQLASIIVLRTVLNYFLQQEIDKAEARRKRPDDPIVNPPPAVGGVTHDAVA
jgi:uncharacterized membrane protein